jgi:putative ABC transport system substrate-binding protein
MGKILNSKWKYLALLLVIFTLTFTAACGNSNEETTTNQEAQKDTTTENQDAQKTESPEEQVQKKADEAPKRLDKTDKKIAIVASANQTAGWQKISEEISFKMLKEVGYDTENTEFKIIREADNTKVADVTKQIREFNPNLAIILDPSLSVPLTKSLEGASFPVVSRSCRESQVVDSSGIPLKNITGINATTADIIIKGANLVTMVNPSIEKKTVFIVGKYAPGGYPKEMVEGQLKSLGVTLKAYEVPETEDEFYSLVQKYENDPEVSWIMYGGNFFKLKNGSIGISVDSLNYITNNCKKMSITFVDSLVEKGMFGGVSVDLIASVEQQMEYAVKLLNGEDIKSLKAEDPKNVFIYYNKMTADKIGVELPLQALESAYRVYTDYDGNYIGK